MNDVSTTGSPLDPWRATTPARIALGRAGAGMPTNEVLRFGWAHAMARDAIHAPFDAEALASTLQSQGWDTVQVHSRAGDRTYYLRRPDLGRQLPPEDSSRLKSLAKTPKDLCIVIGDGLSAIAVERHAAPLLAELRPKLPAGLSLTPVVIASQARVALADEIAEDLGARLSIILIGERPGLSSPDSLGVYVTHAPRRGRHDAERNCISNIRSEGLGYAAAALKLAWLIREALRRGLTGVELKDESHLALVDGKETP